MLSSLGYGHPWETSIEQRLRIPLTVDRLTAPRSSEPMKFQFPADRDFFERLLRGPGETLIDYADLFDDRPAVKKRSAFGRVRSERLAQPNVSAPAASCGSLPIAILQADSYWTT